VLFSQMFVYLGLGADGNGRTTHVTVKRKKDNAGNDNIQQLSFQVVDFILLNLIFIYSSLLFTLKPKTTKQLLFFFFLQLKKHAFLSHEITNIGIGSEKKTHENWLVHQDNFSSVLDALNSEFGGGDDAAPTESTTLIVFVLL
jgi:hypothetical protein